MRDHGAVERSGLTIPPCESTADRIARRGMTEEAVASNTGHFDLILMPMFQIGEIVGAGGCYEALQETRPSETWSQACGLRNRIAHGYAKLSLAVTWDVSTASIPGLPNLRKDLPRRATVRA